MSDLDDLLDDDDKVVVRKQTALPRKTTTLKPAKKVVEVKPHNIDEDDALFEESKDIFDDDDLSTTKSKTTLKGTKLGKKLDGTSIGTKTTIKKKVDKAKITDKIFGAKDKAGSEKKSNFQAQLETMNDNSFFQPKAPVKSEEPEKIEVVEKKEPVVVVAEQPGQIVQEKSPITSQQEVLSSTANNNNTQAILESLEQKSAAIENSYKENSTFVAPEVSTQNVSSSKEPERTLSIEGVDLTTSIAVSRIESDKERNSIEPPTIVVNESPVHSHNEVSPSPQYFQQQQQQPQFEAEKSPQPDNQELPSASPTYNFSQLSFLQAEVPQPKKAQAWEVTIGTVTEKRERKEDNLDLALLTSKTESILKPQLPSDVFVPGNQRIIRKRKEKNEEGNVENKQARKSLHAANENKYHDMNESMIRLNETFVEKFEKEDYEAARPLGVDEFLKKFLVSENPSADQYSVPLTKFSTQVQITNAFFLNPFNQTLNYGKPKTIKRISSSMIIVGTSTGLVCGFDTERKFLIFKLGETREGTYGSVTAVAYREGAKFLVAGHENGNIVIYDTQKKAVAKMISNSHESAVVGLEILDDDPFQYISIDATGIAMFGQVEKLMLVYNHESFCIFPSAVNFNFVQMEILSHKYFEFKRVNRIGEEEIFIAYAGAHQVMVATFEPISKNRRILLKYGRPPVVYEGAIPYICWYQRQPMTRILLGEDEKLFVNTAEGPIAVRDIIQSKYWLFMGWGFCIFLVEMRIVEGVPIVFEDIGYIKFGAEIIHLQLIDKNLLLAMDASYFIHLIHVDDFTNYEDFYTPDGNKAKNQSDEVRIYSEHFGMAEDAEVAYMTSFFFKEPSGKFKKLYHNSIRTDFFEKETLFVHSKAICTIKLNTWENILEEVEAQNHWLKLFTVSLALYHNTIKEITQNPDEEQRKYLLRQNFKDKLRRFVTNQIMRRQVNAANPNDSSFIEEVTLTLIDFCLETRMEDFLFTDGKLCLETFGFKDIFFKSLEPFVRWNKIHTFPSLQPLQEVIDFFLSKGKVSVAQQLIANLDLERWNEEERDHFLLSLMTIILEKNLFTALPYVCIKGTMNFTLPFFTFLNSASEAERKGEIQKKKDFILRCLWFIKTIFKRKVAFMDELISEEKTKEILKDLVLLFMEEAHLKKFYDVEPVLTTVLIGMLFTGELSFFLEDFYGQIPLFEISTDPELKHNLHFQMLNRIDRFFEKYFSAVIEQEILKRQAFFAFILSKVVEEQKHKFLAENICKDSARYLMKHHNKIDDLIILDYKISQDSLQEHEMVYEISEQLLIERKGTMIERMLMYARSPLRDNEIVNELIGLATFAEPLCYLLSLKKEYSKCLKKYLDPSTPRKSREKAIQWVMTTMRQLIASRDPDIESFKKAVLERVGELVLIDSDKMTNFIKNNFKKEEIKAVINQLSKKTDVQLIFVDSFITEAQAQGPGQVDEDIIEVYVKLLAQSKDKKHRKKILPELQKLGVYPSKCLDICLENKVKDAAAFLQEMRGNRDGIRIAIDLRFEILQEYLTKSINKCIKRRETYFSQKQAKKTYDRFVGVSSTIRNHFPHQSDVWFDLLEKVLRTEELIYRMTESKVMQESYRNMFQAIFGKTFVDEIIDCLPFEAILQELSERSWKIPSSITKQFLLKMLRENEYDQKFSFSALGTLKAEIYTLLNINLIPSEVKGVSSNVSANSRLRYLPDSDKVLVFDCGHVYNSRHFSGRSEEPTCEACNNIDVIMATKIFEAKLKKLSNQTQHQYQQQNLRKDQHQHQQDEEEQEFQRARRETTPALNKITNYQMNQIRIETRLSAIDRSKKKMAEDVNDLVYKYQVL